MRLKTAALFVLIPLMIPVPSLFAQVVISELMYHPPDQLGEYAEFLELVNAGAEKIDVSGFTFSGIKFTFPQARFLEPGETVVLTRDAAVFKQCYGSDANYVYTGKLDDGGEKITLFDSTGKVVDELTYDDIPPWPVTPDGLGPSLELISIGEDNNSPRNWAACTDARSHTAGQANSVKSQTLPPWVVAVDYPHPVKPGISFHMRAEVQNADAVYLCYRFNFAAEQRVRMIPSGEQDPLTGSRLFSVQMPVLPIGFLLRFRLELTGPQDRQANYPRSDDTVRYDGFIVDDPKLSTRLPVFHWYIEPNRFRAALDHRDTDETEPAVLAFNGKVYDAVQIRVRGGSARWWPKFHWKFILPQGHDFEAPGLLERAVDRFNLQGSFGDKSFLREMLSYESLQEAGVPSHEVFHVRLNQNGSFFGLYVFLEQPDDDWLKRHNLDEEASRYKAYADASFPVPLDQLPVLYEKDGREWEDYTDLLDFLAHVNDPDPETRRRFLFDNLDLPEVVSYLAVQAVVHNNDHIAKNYYLYRDTLGTGRWAVHPWDMDLTFGRNYLGEPSDEWGEVLNDLLWANVDVVWGRPDVSPSHPLFGDRFHQKWDFLWNRLIDALFQEPDIRQMYYRRLRTLMDELLVPGKYEARIDELLPLFEAEAAMDVSIWGQYGQPQTAREAADLIKTEYLPARRTHLFVTHRVPGQIPPEQTAAARVVINEIMYEPPGGTDDEFVELMNPSWTEAVDISGWSVEEIGLQVPAGTVALPRACVVFAKKDVRFRGTYGQGLFVAGQYGGKLADSGGALTLRTASDQIIEAVTYGVSSPWPVAGGNGFSLERLDPVGEGGSAFNWAQSGQSGGSPGRANSASFVPSARALFPIVCPWPASFTGIAVSNTSGQPAHLQFDARRPDGSALRQDPAEMDLGAGAQEALLAEEILGVSRPAIPPVWMQMLSDRQSLGSFYLTGGDTELDGSPAGSGVAELLYFVPVLSGPDVLRGHSAETSLSIANPNDTPVTVQIRLIDGPTGTERVPLVERILPAYGFLFARMSEFFGSSRITNAYVTVSSGQGRGIVGVASTQLEGTRSLAAVNGQPQSASWKAYSAQLASGSHYFTRVSIVNCGLRQTVRVAAVSDSGEPVGKAVRVSLAPGQMLDEDVGDLLQLQGDLTGSIRVEADSPGILGTVFFGEPNRLELATALPLQTERLREAVFSQVANTAEIFTGVALYNPGSVPANVRLKVFTADGQVSGEANFVLEAGKRLARTLAELVPTTAGQVKGYIVLSADEPVVAQQLFGDFGLTRISAVPGTVLR